VRDGAPARSPARRHFTIFSRFLAFMFTTRRFATGPRRVAQCAPVFFCLVLIDRSCTHFFFDCCVCRFNLYGLRAHALRLSGCWVSVRRSTSSYFDRVAILTDYFFSNKCGTKKSFFAFIYSLLPLCLQYNLRTREPQWLPPLPLQLLGRITLPATIIPHTVLRSLQYRCPNKVILPLPPPQLLSVITPLSIYYYPVTTFFLFLFPSSCIQ